MKMPVVLWSLVPSILTSNSYQQDKTFRGVASAAVEHLRQSQHGCSGTRATWTRGLPQNPSKPKKKRSNLTLIRTLERHWWLFLVLLLRYFCSQSLQWTAPICNSGMPIVRIVGTRPIKPTQFYHRGAYRYAIGPQGGLGGIIKDLGFISQHCLPPQASNQKGPGQLSVKKKVLHLKKNVTLLYILYFIYVKFGWISSKSGPALTMRLD